jgi:hypothetical protein
MQGDTVNSGNDTISVRMSNESRPELRRFADLLRMSEAQVLKMCFDDLSKMVHSPGEERIPHVVMLIRAALEYETVKPKITSYVHSGSKRAHSSLNEKKGAKS